MIRVLRTETEAASGSVAVLLASLDEQPGAWLGCDVQAEGLYRRESMGCNAPALGFQLDGRELRVQPYSATGVALLERLRTLAAFEVEGSGLVVRFPGADGAPSPVVALLRRFLALFWPAFPELALYGAFSFDYYHLSDGADLPDDGRRRMVLYFAERVLVAREDRATWVHFSFPDLPKVPFIPTAMPDSVRLETLEDDMPSGGHAANVRRGIDRLARGELFSLVLSQTFRRRVWVRGSEAFAALRRLNPYPAMFYLNLGGGERLLGASPDLQVRADESYVESAPVCGTVRRGADPVADADQARALLDSDKEDASLAACADSDRNDKAKVCVPGSVEVLSRRRLHFFSTIIHTIDHTRGRRLQGKDAFDILLAHSTPATVTGLPKAAAIRAISELESTWRGWYAGAVARLSADGSAEVLTVLRAARVVGDVAEVRTGGNLLVDSDPEKEEEETRLKAETMFRVLAGESPRAPAVRVEFKSGLRASLCGPDDAMLFSLEECLRSVGCEVVAPVPGEAPPDVEIVSDGGEAAVRPWAGVAPPVIAVGSAGLLLLQAQGCALKTLDEPRFARRILVDSLEGGFAASLGKLELGVYTRQVVEQGALSARWRPALVGPGGWVIAAERADTRQIVLLCRPDSVQSLKADAGRRLLRAALERFAGSV